MPQREEVFCHVCGAVFPKEDYGLTCPRCESEFTEIIEDNEEDHPAGQHMDTPEPSSPSRRSPRESPRSPAHPFLDHNPWADTGDTEFHEFGNGGGFSRRSYRSPDGRFAFTSTTFSRGLPSRRVRGGLPDVLPGDDPVIRNFNAILQGLTGALYHGQRDTTPGDDHPPWADTHDEDRGRHPFHGGLWPRDADQPQPTAHPLGDMNDILDLFRTDFPYDGHGTGGRPMGRGGVRIMGGNPLSIIASILGGRHGDAVYSQEELDRVISQLIDQNMNGNGAPPAAESAIQALPKKKVDQEMLGTEGKAECSICMEPVELGTEVTVLPCKHWFHFPCIEMWLNQHNTCPHCRRGINNNNTDQENAPGSRNNPLVIPSSPEAPSTRRRSSGIDTRHQHNHHPYHHYHGRHSNNSGSESRRASASAHTPSSPEVERRRSSGQSGQNRNEGHGGGISGWVRSHFGGS